MRCYLQSAVSIQWTRHRGETSLPSARDYAVDNQQVTCVKTQQENCLSLSHQPLTTPMVAMAKLPGVCSAIEARRAGNGLKAKALDGDPRRLSTRPINHRLPVLPQKQRCSRRSRARAYDLR